MSDAFTLSTDDTLACDGYTIVADAVDGQTLDALMHELRPISEAVSGVRGGARNLLRTVPAVRDLAQSDALRAVAERSLGPGALAVRAILFDKTPGANWKVVWHQDLTIAVQERREVEGFGPWTEKEGVPHVQPPVDVLERMVAVRLHLDDCSERNGPVRVIPGSHRSGRLTSAEVAIQRKKVPEVVCTVPRGGVLAFHSLLLHASSPALEPVHRRVVHVEYVGAEWRTLPGGLTWYDAV